MGGVPGRRPPLLRNPSDTAFEVPHDLPAQSGHRAVHLVHGVEVVENPDVDSLRAAVQSVYDAYPQYADYIARIQALLAE